MTTKVAIWERDIGHAAAELGKPVESRLAAPRLQVADPPHEDDRSRPTYVAGHRLRAAELCLRNAARLGGRGPRLDERTGLPRPLSGRKTEAPLRCRAS